MANPMSTAHSKVMAQIRKNERLAARIRNGDYSTKPRKKRTKASSASSAGSSAPTTLTDTPAGSSP